MALHLGWSIIEVRFLLPRYFNIHVCIRLGKQHWLLEDRIKSDKIRDERLTKAGYIVYRIKWKEINSYEGKQYIKEEINKFFEFYKNNLLTNRR